MSLQFIMGNSGSGKSYCLYDTVVREAIENPDQELSCHRSPSSLRCRHKKISVLRIQKAGS